MSMMHIRQKLNLHYKQRRADSCGMSQSSWWQGSIIRIILNNQKLLWCIIIFFKTSSLSIKCKSWLSLRIRSWLMGSYLLYSLSVCLPFCENLWLFLMDGDYWCLWLPPSPLPSFSNKIYFTLFPLVRDSIIASFKPINGLEIQMFPRIQKKRVKCHLF